MSPNQRSNFRRLKINRDFQGRSHVNLRFQLKWLGEWNLNYKKNGICVTQHPSRKSTFSRRRGARRVLFRIHISANILNESPLKNIMTHGSVNKPTIARHYSYFSSCLLCGCMDTARLLLHLISDPRPSRIINNSRWWRDSRWASAKLDAILFVIESE